jgi:hypothetical protein
MCLHLCTCTHGQPIIPSPSTTLTSSLGKCSSHNPPVAQILAGCPIEIELLYKLWAQIEPLSLSVGMANENHPLAAFAGDSEGCVKDGEDVWENFDGPLNNLLQKPLKELQDLV